MYNSTDLKWTKNVKRDNGNSWAYDEYNVGDTFPLNWSRQFAKNAYLPQQGEAILLFQSINRRINNNSKGTYLTHIVTPVDNVRRTTANPTHPYTREVGVVARPSIPKPKPDLYSFFLPNRGACCDLNLITKAPKDVSLKEKQIFFWNFFDSIDSNLDNVFNYVGDGQVDIVEVEEGREVYEIRKHKFYERDNTIIQSAKQIAKQQEKFFCEVCNFSFKEQYPGMGDDFIECHHRTPIAGGGIRKTRVEDLALVCSNCHRMLHRKSDGNYLTVEQLREKYF